MHCIELGILNCATVELSASTLEATHPVTQRERSQHSTAQHSTAQHSTAQHSTARHAAIDTAQPSTAQHSTACHAAIDKRQGVRSQCSSFFPHSNMTKHIYTVWLWCDSWIQEHLGLKQRVDPKADAQQTAINTTQQHISSSSNCTVFFYIMI